MGNTSSVVCTTKQGGDVMSDLSYDQGVLDAVAYLSEVYGGEIYDTNVFERLGVKGDE